MQRRSKHWIYDGGLATRGWIGRTGVDIGLVSGPDSDRKTPMQAAQSNRPKTDDIVRLLTVRKRLSLAELVLGLPVLTIHLR